LGSCVFFLKGSLAKTYDSDLTLVASYFLFCWPPYAVVFKRLFFAPGRKEGHATAIGVAVAAGLMLCILMKGEDHYFSMYLGLCLLQLLIICFGIVGCQRGTSIKPTLGVVVSTTLLTTAYYGLSFIVAGILSMRTG